MHRFYLPPDQCQGSELALSERESHHALHVLRLREGEHAVVLDGVGHEFLCEVGATMGGQVQLAITQKNSIPPLSYQLTLLQAVPKGKLIEAIIEKATELGAFRVIPILSERVVPHLDAENSETKVEKWRLTAIEAIKQCGSAWLPRIEAPVSLKGYLGSPDKFDLTIIASLRKDSRHPREVFRAYYAEHRKLPQSIGVWVGPEGDFTPAEMGAVRSAGALPITLGRLILRTETAAIYCLSILNYELQSPLLDQHLKNPA